MGGGADGNQARNYNISDLRDLESKQESQTINRVGGGADGSNPRGYDLAELRKKLE